jgi:predicted DNA-binding antitoxin AbrB/MazE fold protein
MIAVQAIYDGKVFIPEKPCKITSGSTVTLTIETINAGVAEREKKLAAFKKLSEEIISSNKTDPLPSAFDEILSKRVQFRELDLS